MLSLYSLILVPFIFAYMDRLRGTDSKLKIGKLIIGNSVWYSFLVGLFVGYCFNDWILGVAVSLLFEVGERRNWQEIGYFIMKPTDVDVWFELIARSIYWYVPSITVMYMFNHISLNTMITANIVASFIMISAIGLSKLVFKFKRIPNNNEWSFGEYIRGFMWGSLLVWIIVQ